MTKRFLTLLMALLLTLSAVPVRAEDIPAWQEDGVLRILGIGNSHTEDTFQFIHDVAFALGIEQVEIAYCWIGGSTLEQHIGNLAANNPAYELCTYETDWTKKQNVTLQSALTGSSWDFITLQQEATAGGQADRLAQAGDFAASVHALCPDAVLAWNMIWAFPEEWDEIPYFEEPFTRLYQHNTEKMYGSVLAAVQECIVPVELIDVIIPNATAIHNARQTYMNLKPSGLYRDGLHLSYIRGRYIASMTAVAALTGLDITQIEEHIAQNYMKTEDYAHCAVEAVANALANPWSVTPVREKE